MFANIDKIDLEYAKKLVWGGLNGYDVFTNNLTLSQQLEAQTLLAYENSNITANAIAENEQTKGNRCD